MTYVYETVMGGKNLVVEYCYSSVDNRIKIVEMTADGKYHRESWMSFKGLGNLLAELMSDYDGIMLGQQDDDYDSEMDLDRDVPDGEIEHDGSPINVDWIADAKWNMDDTSVDITMINECMKVEGMYGV